MIVVSDTTPLISMMKIGELEVIHKLFGEIQIPQAVFNELVNNEKFPDESRAVKECPFIKTVEVKDVKAVEQLRNTTGLDIGESEAIVLSDILKADYLLMDEMKGRKVAQQKDIVVMGTIGMLMAAYTDELIARDEVLSCIDNLKYSGRHISNKLYEQLIDRMRASL